MKKILIIRCGALGDLVYATSVIDAIRMEFGEETIIDFISTPGTGTLFASDPRVHQVFPLKHKKIPILLSKQKKDIIKYSKKNPYDILINFEFGRQFKSLVKKITAHKKAGAFCEDIQLDKETVHVVDITKLMFKSLVSEDVYKKSFPKLIGTSNKEVINKYNLPSKFIIISPSNSHQKRNILNYRAWGNDKWSELMGELQKKTTVVIVGNKGEDNFFNQLKPYPTGVIDLVAKTPLADLIGLINVADALVATDTGTAHISAAVNTEVFALIGPTPADVTGPYQSPDNIVHIISSNQVCSPCYKTEVMKNCTENICMKEISVEMVLNTIKLANLL